MSDTADLLRAIASLLWVAIGIAVVLLLAKVLVARSGQLKTLGVGPTGLTMEFVEAKVDQAIRAEVQPSGERVGQAAKRSVVDRLQRNADLLADARILWVDDHPENNTPVIDLLRRFGSVVETPRSNSEAVALLAGARYDVIISDVSRDDEGPNSELMGVELASEVFARWSQQIILFTARFNPATLPGKSEGERLTMVRELERTVFGRTNRMDVALHLIMDILER
jgi:CheY-like chemotaxis protein